MAVREEDNCFFFEDEETGETKVVSLEDLAGGLVCFSGGKDSTAMLLRMLELCQIAMDNEEELPYPITRIAFADTGFEFDELYNYLEFLSQYIQEKYPWAPVLEMLSPIHTWKEWFYGEITRGNNKGKIRGAPLKAHPCWWSRDAKIVPLQRAQKGMRYSYVGIAADEAHRVQKRDPKKITSLQMRYPLIEWGWTEADCMAYIDQLGLGNCLYLNFNRIGCYHCPKQNLRSWYEVWENWPEKWIDARFWDEESIRVRGMGLRTGDYTLEQLQERFEAGWIPERRDQVYECNTCAAVGLHTTGILKMEDFDDDNAFERHEKFLGSVVADEMKSPESIWIPPSKRESKVEWL